ncbi:MULTISPECIES: glutaredoxin domain-containing protein [Halomonadaceae]|uniref:glutaredoxin family protein n=1 Tax=Halomonadaceae TaxID=28256 RepID=UPI001597B3A2|nr:MULTISPECIES: glutaredoxin domain-containing protein [Halomonas]QJQ96223.1 glutaredoxin [Halomonas sp. PA5]
MRLLLRYFFRTLRVVLTPVMLMSEKLTTPKSAIERTPEEQSRVEKESQSLALYQFQSCPFCVKVRKEMARLGLDIELRDVQRNPEHRQALLNGGGRTMVPCLLITHDDGREEWMYESNDINAYLRQRFENA